ncbi:MAG: polysaccharide biosynthesis tyrosine autokinase [Planctomycetota bacterium]
MSKSNLPKRQPVLRSPVLRNPEAPPPPTPAHRRVTIDSSPRGAEEAGSISILSAAWRRKWTVTACVVASLASAFTYLHFAEPVFQSSAVIYVDDSMPTTLDGYSNPKQEKLEALRQVMKSSAMLSRVAERPEVVALFPDRTVDARLLKAMIRVDSDDDGHVLRVHAESPTPRVNAAVANALANTFIHHQTVKHRSGSTEQLKVLRREEGRLEQQLEANWANLLDFQRRHKSLGYGGDVSSVSEEQLASLSKSLIEMRLAHAEAKVALTAMQAAGDDLPELRRIAREMGIHDGVWAVETGVEYRALVNEVTDAELEHANLLKSYGPDHRMAKIAEHRAEVAREAMAEVQAFTQRAQLEQVRDALVKHEAMLTARIADLEDLHAAEKARAISTTHLALEYDHLESVIDRTTGQLESVQAQIRDVDLSDDFTALNVSLLEPATTELLMVAPRSKVIVAMALMCGLMLGVGAAFLRELLDDRLRGDEVKTASAFGLRILGDIPTLRPDKREAVFHGDLGVANAPSSTFAEAFRGLRTGVRFGSHGYDASSLLVASAMPGEGKSVVAANLAIAYAQTGLRTLLIDSDMRNARQLEIFRLDARASGLAEVLRGESTLEASAVATGCPDLDLLPAGNVDRSPSDLLNSKAFARLQAEAAERYDQIIIDSPPVNAVNDARIASTLVGAVVVVLRKDRSRGSEVKAAIESLNAVQAPLIGVVLNGQEHSVTPYPYDRLPEARAELRAKPGEKYAPGFRNGSVTPEPVAAAD